MVSSACCVLLGSFLAASFFGKIDGAIQCHQCNDCADAGKLPAMKKCASVTILDAVGEMTRKLVTKQSPGIDEATLLAAIEQSKQLVNAEMPKDTSPASCFKMASKMGDGEEIVLRGCSAKVPKATCNENEKMVSCVCTGDGCNSATGVLSSTLLNVCVLFVVAFLNI